MELLVLVLTVLVIISLLVMPSVLIVAMDIRPRNQLLIWLAGAVPAIAWALFKQSQFDAHHRLEPTWFDGPGYGALAEIWLWASAAALWTLGCVTAAIISLLRR